MTGLWAAVFPWPRGRTPTRGGAQPAGFWSKNHKAGERFWGKNRGRKGCRRWVALGRKWNRERSCEGAVWFLFVGGEGRPRG